MKKSTMITGYVSAFMLLTGIAFKVQHWPGASILIILGSAIFAFGYGIQLFLEKRKIAEGFLAKFVAIWVLGLMIFLSVSFVLKMQHWPGASIAVILSHFILFATIPVLIIYAIKEKDGLKKLNFHNEAILLIFLISFTIVIGHLRINKNVLESFIPLNQTVIKEMKFHELKSNELFATLENAVNASNAGKNYLEKAKEVKNASDSLVDYILNLENMITLTTGQEKCNFDSLTVLAKEAVDAPAKIMVIEKKGEELKQKLIAYRELIDENTNSRGKEIIGLFFNTEDPTPIENEKNHRTWVTEKFGHLPLISVLFGLNQMRSNVRLLEAETMIFIQAMVAKAVASASVVHNEEKKEIKKDRAK